MKYRKKPVVVEAMQLRWDNWSEMCDFAGVGRLADGKPSGVMDGEEIGMQIPTLEIGMQIPTLEGVMLARQDDWIIRGVNGELYPCKPDIFEQTYERVESDEIQERIQVSGS